jgi:NAD(P)H-dependent flavin oxidoreductase YrpB (nitropropane dioxygenase family)
LPRWRSAPAASLGTRFLATVESPLHQNFKQAMVDSDGHDTQLSETPTSRQAWCGPAP